MVDAAAGRTRPRSSPSRPPQWALQAWGVPPAGAGARCGPTGSSRPGIVGSYREVAGITDPAQAIGPRAVRAAPTWPRRSTPSVRALQLPDEAALLKAMGQGELEAAVDEHDRAVALAPADVQAEIDQREAEWEDAQVRAHIAGGARDAEAQAEAEAGPQDAAADLARLAVADAARREWTEAHAGLAARAEAAERELRARGLAERIPVTDAEVASRFGGAARDAGDRPGGVGPDEGRADRPGRRGPGPGPRSRRG